MTGEDFLISMFIVLFWAVIIRYFLKERRKNKEIENRNKLYFKNFIDATNRVLGTRMQPNYLTDETVIIVQNYGTPGYGKEIIGSVKIRLIKEHDFFTMRDSFSIHVNGTTNKGKSVGKYKEIKGRPDTFLASEYFDIIKDMHNSVTKSYDFKEGLKKSGWMSV
ncbi:MAG: hypothetical protein ACRBG0_28190 [Lewinella sp.]|uniref:hypothetical protein n=1 Tax=Lewinella sp. TaxID=2004506 RepID=UPI003D6C1DA9